MGPCMELGVLVVEDVPGYFEHFMTVEVRTQSLVWCCTPLLSPSLHSVHWPVLSSEVEERKGFMGQRSAVCSSPDAHLAT